MCSEAWCTLGAMFKARSGARPPSTKELFQIIPMHAMNREIIPGRKRWFDGVRYNLWSLLTPWVAASRLLAAWHTQHQSPDWCCVWQAMPFSFSHARRGALQILDKLLNSYVSLLHSTCHAYTSTRLPISCTCFSTIFLHDFTSCNIWARMSTECNIMFHSNFQILLRFALLAVICRKTLAPDVRVLQKSNYATLCRLWE